MSSPGRRSLHPVAVAVVVAVWLAIFNAIGFRAFGFGRRTFASLALVLLLWSLIGPAGRWGSRRLEGLSVPRLGCPPRGPVFVAAATLTAAAVLLPFVLWDPGPSRRRCSTI